MLVDYPHVKMFTETYADQQNFLVALGFELRAFTLNQSTSPFL
jgi:hypothetical protein